MRIAFYAPLKSPDHPIPSGDRLVAQLFFAALQASGYQVSLASRFRSYDRTGDQVRQSRLASLGGLLAGRFLARCRAAPETAPEHWFTYHLYHKAPDWLGPVISHALAIPYVIAEASNAPKQRSRAWAFGREAAERAIRRADAVIGLNPADRDCVIPLLQDPRRWIPMKPFIDVASYGRPSRTNSGPPRLIAVAMMRHGDKLASYRILGDSLVKLLDLAWTLEVVGDGPARKEVEEALHLVGERVTWAGALGSTDVAKRLAAADLCVWPALNEAFGMALLEAQASGLPVVAGDSGGVSQIIVPEVTGLLVPPGNASAFAAAVRDLVVDSGRRVALAEAAWQRVRAEHDVSSAARRLDAVISMVGQADHLLWNHRLA